MRKDVKLGLAIGAILLAVIIVYAATPRHKNPSATPVVLKGNTPADTGGSQSTQSPKPDDGPPATPSDPSAQPQLPTPPDSVGGPGATGGGGGSDIPKPPSETKTTPDWGALLRASDNELPALIGRTQVTAVHTPDRSGPSDTPPDFVDMGPGTPHDHGGMAPAVVIPPTTQQSAVGGTARTHKVQPGETLAAIAKSVYGKSSMYLAIEKANPSVNANRLKVGTVLTLPPATAVSADSSTPNTAAAAYGYPHTHDAIDPTTQYRVQPGDSLQRIAVKLYGNAARTDELYTTNKEVIGDDPAKLKVGEVLKLPEPPTATASR